MVDKDSILHWLTVEDLRLADLAVSARDRVCKCMSASDLSDSSLALHDLYVQIRSFREFRDMLLMFLHEFDCK